MEDYLRALARREERSALRERFFAQWDVLLGPVAMTNAFPHCEPGSSMDIDGQPSPTIALRAVSPGSTARGIRRYRRPWRDERGLPLAVQLVAGRWQESKLLTIARALEHQGK